MSEESPETNWLSIAVAIFAGWSILMLLLSLAGLALSRVTLRHADALSTSSAPPQTSSLLRRVYAGVLVVCCVLYYVSLPLVLLAVLAMAGGTIYAMIEAGHIPIRLVLLLILMVFVTFGAVIKSLFVRTSNQDPGMKLDLMREPKLREALDEVAARIGTRPVDTVYITPDTTIAVFERKHGERCLLLGVAVMEGMPLRAFKAILAHEYGHFSDRDTAGGGYALRVRRSLFLFIVHLAQSGGATWWNPAWWFAKTFHRLFLRISQGASRLQEILADRHAALAYGGAAFAEGLRHVIERDVHFDGHADVEVKRALKSGTPLRSLWSIDDVPSDAASKVDALLDRAPSPYDSHPAPRNRIRWVRDIVPSTDDGQATTTMVWDLFSNRSWLEREMTLLVYGKLAERGIRLPPLPSVEPAP
jgi:Zn-dependent protease with chaperone function